MADENGDMPEWLEPKDRDEVMAAKDLLAAIATIKSLRTRLDQADRERDEAVKAEREACAKAVELEAVADWAGEQVLDDAYNLAINHAATTIRARASIPTPKQS